MMQIVLAALVVVCILAAIYFHETGNNPSGITYEVLFWLFVSLSVFVLLVTSLQIMFE
jgi:hypothetical protein